MFCKLYNKDNTPYAECPRYVLEKAVKEFKEFGYEIKAGIELEWAVVKEDTRKPIDMGHYASMHSLAEGSHYIEPLLK